jgi:hypothetical protein
VDNCPLGYPVFEPELRFFMTEVPLNGIIRLFVTHIESEISQLRNPRMGHNPSNLPANEQQSKFALKFEPVRLNNRNISSQISMMFVPLEIFLMGLNNSVFPPFPIFQTFLAFPFISYI